MSRIEFEDRSQPPTPEEASRRHALLASHAIIQTAIAASQGNPAIGISALALALGQGAARTGTPLDVVIEAMQKSYQSTLEALAEQASQRPSDA